MLKQIIEKNFKSSVNGLQASFHSFKAQPIYRTFVTR